MAIDPLFSPRRLMTTKTLPRQRKPISYSPFTLHMKEEEDAVLIARFLEGNDHALTALYNKYSSRLQNFLYRKIGDRDRAEELFQETFIRVYKHLHRFNREKKFST